MPESPSGLRVDTGEFRKRRTIADAIEVLSRKTGFSNNTEAVVEISGLCLRSGRETSIVGVVCRQLGLIVPLPSSSHFSGIRSDTSTRQTFEISKLSKAVVNASCQVTLTDGLKLRGVEVLPDRLPEDFSKEHMAIVDAAVRFMGVEHRCYRYIDPVLLPNIRSVDFSTLAGRKLVGLSDFVQYCIDKCGLTAWSRQTFANVLIESGIIIRRNKRLPHRNI